MVVTGFGDVLSWYICLALSTVVGEEETGEGTIITDNEWDLIEKHLNDGSTPAATNPVYRLVLQL